MLYMPQGCDLDEVCRLLGVRRRRRDDAGEFHHPPSMDPDAARSASRRPAHAVAPRSTAPGSSPGFISEAVPLVLTSIQRRLDHPTIDEFADLSSATRRTCSSGSWDSGRPRRASTSAGSPRRPVLRPVAAARSPTLSACRSTRWSPPARCARPPAASTSPPARSPPAPSPPSGWWSPGCAAAEPLAARSAPTGTAPTDLDAGVGPPRHRLARHRRRRRPLDVELRFAVPLERMAEIVPRLHGQPRGQRRPRRVRRCRPGSARPPICPRSSPPSGDRESDPARCARSPS